MKYWNWSVCSGCLLLAILVYCAGPAGGQSKPAVKPAPLPDSPAEKSEGRYTVWVYKMVNGAWTRQPSRNLHTDDPQVAQRYVADIQRVRGWTATSNLPAELAATGDLPAGRSSFPEVEEKLRSIAEPLPTPQASDWLAQHEEPGQTFAQYVRSNPIRRSARLKTIHLCLIGEFSPAQRRIVETAREYLQLFYDAPVRIHAQLALDTIPAQARRTNPGTGDEQILSTYVLDDVLKPARPADALAYLAFTANDLWPGEGWNFVFGQASLRDRTGVWSIHRNGDPAQGDDEFQLCLKRTLRTATHETGHILGIQHCTAFHCNLNGSNHLAEGDAKPLHFCPVCLRKLCWNLRIDPVSYLQKLQAFYRAQHFDDEAAWIDRAVPLLRGAGS